MSFSSRPSNTTSIMNLETLSQSELRNLESKLILRLEDLDRKQASKKLVLNKGYGAFGYNKFRYYNTSIASSITCGGRIIITAMINSANEYLNKRFNTNIDYIVYSHTDSCFLKLPVPFEDIPKEYEGVKKAIDKALEAVMSLNPNEDVIRYEKEKIFKNIFFTDASARYCAHVVELDGKEVNKYSVTGLESLRSDIPPICRDWLFDMYKFILHKQYDELRTYYNKCKTEFLKLSMPEIGKPMGYNKEGDAWHVRAINVYKKHFDGDILIGDKVNIFTLIKNNPFASERIATPLDMEIESINKYIDRNSMFIKNVHNPIQRLIGFENETLEGGFSF